MNQQALIQFMRDTVGPLITSVLKWDIDDHFFPAVETVHDRLGVTTTDRTFSNEKQAAEWRTLVKAHARLAIWQRVWEHTAAFHYVLMPDGISAQLQQIHASAAKLAADAESKIPGFYSIEVGYMRTTP